MNGLARRLAQLEVLVRGQESELSPEERVTAERYVRLCEDLFATMAPEHASIVAQVWIGREKNEWSSDRGWLHLATIAEHLLRGAFHGDDSFRLALPRPVAEVYLANRGWPFDECSSCRLPLPYEGEHWRGMQHVPERHHFSRCPDCGGAVRRRPIQVRRPA